MKTVIPREAPQKKGLIVPAAIPQVGPPGQTQQWTYSHPIYPRPRTSIIKISSKYGMQTHFKGNRAIKGIVSQTQRQGPNGEEKWGHLLVPVWRTHVLWFWKIFFMIFTKHWQNTSFFKSMIDGLIMLFAVCFCVTLT